MNFETGDNLLLEWKSSKRKMYMINFMRNDEHDGKINMTDVKEDEGLFVTGGEDGFVKIWTK